MNNENLELHLSIKRTNLAGMYRTLEELKRQIEKTESEVAILQSAIEEKNDESE